jgi:hippurate hydrolase
LFTRFPRPDYGLALHLSADLPAGCVGHTEGYALASVNSVDLTIRGLGGHGAFPHKAKDPIVLAAQTVLALQTIVSRELTPGEPAVLTVGAIHGGTKHNIIPDEVRLQLTLRSYTDEVRQQSIEAIRRITRGLALAAGLPEDRLPVVRVRAEPTPATYNDPKLTQRLAGAWVSWFGEQQVVPCKPVMGAEDFGEYGRTTPRVPICIFWLGAMPPAAFQEKGQAATPLPSLHSPLFAPVPEPTIKTGVTAMTAAVLELLGAQ